MTITPATAAANAPNVRPLPTVIHMGGRHTMTADALAAIITNNFTIDIDASIAYRMHCQLFGVHLAMTVAHNWDAADYFQRLSARYWQISKI